MRVVRNRIQLGVYENLWSGRKGFDCENGILVGGFCVWGWGLVVGGFWYGPCFNFEIFPNTCICYIGIYRYTCTYNQHDKNSLGNCFLEQGLWSLNWTRFPWIKNILFFTIFLFIFHLITWPFTATFDSFSCLIVEKGKQALFSISATHCTASHGWCNIYWSYYCVSYWFAY